MKLTSLSFSFSLSFFFFLFIFFTRSSLFLFSLYPATQDSFNFSFFFRPQKLPLPLLIYQIGTPSFFLFLFSSLIFFIFLTQKILSFLSFPSFQNPLPLLFTHFASFFHHQLSLSLKNFHKHSSSNSFPIAQPLSSSYSHFPTFCLGKILFYRLFYVLGKVCVCM